MQGHTDPLLLATSHSESLPPRSSNIWTTLEFEPGGCGGAFTLRSAINAANAAIWEWYCKFDELESKALVGAAAPGKG